MSQYRFTPEAVDDLFEIWTYTAQDNAQAADRVENAIHAACVLLASRPNAGRLRPDLTPRPFRFWVVRRYPNYLIVYDSETKPLQIIRILHAARDLPTILT
jgi:plasmid stabilization system protein ParE